MGVSTQLLQETVCYFHPTGHTMFLVNWNCILILRRNNKVIQLFREFVCIDFVLAISSFSVFFSVLDEKVAVQSRATSINNEQTQSTCCSFLLFCMRMLGTWSIERWCCTFLNALYKTLLKHCGTCSNVHVRKYLCLMLLECNYSNHLNWA